MDKDWLNIEFDREKALAEAKKAWIESGAAQKSAEIIGINAMSIQMSIHNLAKEVKRIANFLEKDKRDE